MIEQFHGPATVREALTLKKRYQGRAAFLAGGTYLNSSDCHQQPKHFISLAGLGLDRIELKQGRVEIGALCTYQRLIEDRRVPEPLKAAAVQLASRNVRNMATLGGHVASRVTNSDLIPMLVALDAKLVLSRAGATRTLRVAEYVAKPVAGLITKLVLPKSKAGRIAACRNLRGSANGRSIVSAAVSATLVRGVVKDPIIAVGGLARSVVRVGAVERALHGRPLPALDELQALVSRAVRPAATPLASAAFRRREAGAVVALAFRDAFGKKGARS